MNHGSYFLKFAALRRRSINNLLGDQTKQSNQLHIIMKNVLTTKLVCPVD